MTNLNSEDITCVSLLSSDDFFLKLLLEKRAFRLENQTLIGEGLRSVCIIYTWYTVILNINDFVLWVRIINDNLRT